MTQEEVAKLKNGVYIVHWSAIPDNISVAAVGRGPRNEVWLAPTNWITVPTTTEWPNIHHVTLITTQLIERRAVLNDPKHRENL